MNEEWAAFIKNQNFVPNCLECQKSHILNFPFKPSLQKLNETVSILSARTSGLDQKIFLHSIKLVEFECS